MSVGPSLDAGSLLVRVITQSFALHEVQDMAACALAECGSAEPDLRVIQALVEHLRLRCAQALSE